MSLTDDNKIDNLWKKSRGVVDIEKEAAYYDVAQKPFVENILNKDIFSNEVPDEIPGQLINVSGFGSISENSVIGLDDTFHSAGVPPGGVLSNTPVNEISNVIGYPGYKLSSIGYPYLTYYHRIPLIEHPTSNKTKPGQKVKTTWYIPDPTNPELSALRYSINFKKGGLRHYEQRFYADTTNPNPIEIKEGFSPHLMVFDNKSGYVLLYGDDDSAFNWKITSASTGSTGPLLMSFIRYEGPLGASGAGLDASFNNVDISENLISEDTDLIQVATFEIQRPPPNATQYWTQVSPIGSSRTYDLATADPSPNIYGYYLIAECDEVYGGTVNLGFFEIEVILNLVPRAFGSGDFKFNSKFYLGINGYRPYSSGAGEVIFHAIRSTFDTYKDSPVKKIILVFDRNDRKYKVYIHFDYNITDYGLIKFQQTGSTDINVVSSWNKLMQNNGFTTLDKKLRFQVRITENDSNKMTNYDGLSYNNAWKIKNFDFDNTLPMNEIPGQPSTGTQTSDTLYEYDMFTRLTEEGIRTRNVLVAENELFVQDYNLIKKWEKQAPNFPADWICLVHFTKDPTANYYYDKNYAAANAMVYLRLSYNLNGSNSTSPQAALITQEVLFNVSYIWGNNAPMNVIGNINIISQHCSNFPVYMAPTNTIIKSLELIKDNQNAYNPTKVLLYCRCEYDQNIIRNNVDCYVEIYNNRDNVIRSTSRPGPANYWAGNINFGESVNQINSSSVIEKVELGNDITSETITFKSKRLGTNKLILTRDTGFYTSANSNADCPSLTEDHEILTNNAYKTYATKDYANNLILNAEHGNVIVNVKDPDYVEADDGGVQANYGGLKIFNSGPAVNQGNGIIEPPAPMIELVSQNGTGTGLAWGTNGNGLPYGSAKIYTNSEKNTVIEGAGNNLSFNTGWTERSFDNSRISFNLQGDVSNNITRVLLANRNGSTGKIEFTINEGIDDTDTIIFTPNYNRFQSSVDKPYAFKVDSSTDKTIVKTDLDVGNNSPITRTYGGTIYNVVSGHSGRNTKINSYPDHHGQLTDRAYVQEVVVDLSSSQVDTLGVVDGDWVTIAKTGIFAQNTGSNSGIGPWECIERNDMRANAVIEITDKTGSHHHHIKFIANASFNKISLKVLSNQYYVRNRFTAVRIVAAGTYEGNVLQVKIRCPSVSNGAAVISGYDSDGDPIYDPYYGGNVSSMNIRVWQNTNDSGWVVNENLIEVDNNPTVYSKNNGVPVSNFGTAYASLGTYSESIVYVDQNKEIGSTFKEDFLNGVLIEGGLNMINGDIDMNGNDILNIKNLLGDDNRVGNMIVQADNKWNTSSTRVNAKAVSFNSPVRILSGLSSDINDNLNNSSTQDGTMIFDYNLSSLIIKPAVQGPAGSNTNPQILMAPTTIILFDTDNNFNPTFSGGQISASQFWSENFIGNTTQSSNIMKGSWSTGRAWPNTITTPFPIPLSQPAIQAAHDGYVTAVHFCGLLSHTSNTLTGTSAGRIFAIKRVKASNGIAPFGQRSRIDLMIQINNNTPKKAGTIIEGPPGGIAGTVESGFQEHKWRFEINPSDINSRIDFEAGDTIKIGIKAIDNSANSTDTFRVFFNNLGGTGVTFLKSELTVVYLPKH